MMQISDIIKNCTYSDKIPVDRHGNLDDFANGQYGYRVFYDINDAPEIFYSSFFDDLPEEYSGQIEFSVDGNGNEIDEVLVWLVEIDEDGSTVNADCGHLNTDISILINDFNANHNTHLKSTHAQTERE